MSAHRRHSGRKYSPASVSSVSMVPKAAGRTDLPAQVQVGSGIGLAAISSSRRSAVTPGSDAKAGLSTKCFRRQVLTDTGPPKPERVNERHRTEIARERPFPIRPRVVNGDARVLDSACSGSIFHCPRWWHAHNVIARPRLQDGCVKTSPLSYVLDLESDARIQATQCSPRSAISTGISAVPCSTRAGTRNAARSAGKPVASRQSRIDLANRDRHVESGCGWTGCR